MRRSTLPTAVAASTAIPLMVAPVPVGAGRYLDGATISATSADAVLDRLPDVTEVLVLAPSDWTSSTSTTTGSTRGDSVR